MSSPTVKYIDDISEPCLSDMQVKEILFLLENEPDMKNRQDALSLILRRKVMHPAQVTLIAESTVIRHSIDLQYILKRFVIAQKYRAAELKSTNETTWEYVLWVLAAS